MGGANSPGELGVHPPVVAHQSAQVDHRVDLRHGLAGVLLEDLVGADRKRLELPPVERHAVLEASFLYCFCKFLHVLRSRSDKQGVIGVQHVI
eukprot:37189-Pyramimonas_sp.AAC.1